MTGNTMEKGDIVTDEMSVEEELNEENEVEMEITENRIDKRNETNMNGKMSVKNSKRRNGCHTDDSFINSRYTSGKEHCELKNETDCNQVENMRKEGHQMQDGIPNDYNTEEQLQDIDDIERKRMKISQTLQGNVPPGLVSDSKIEIDVEANVIVLDKDTKFMARSKPDTSGYHHRCSQCDEAFQWPFQLNRHRRIKHEGQYPYKCDVCCKPFDRISTLKDHQHVHSDSRPFSCDKCGKNFKLRGNLRKHIREFHTEDKLRFRCAYCNKEFNTKEQLTSHFVVHNEEKQFECEICKKKFHRKHNLMEHQVTHKSDKNFKCLECGLCFNRKYALKIHSRNHMEVKPYRCDICPSSFSQLHALKNHIRRHTGERPYKCGFCDKSFAQQSTLQLHTKRHTGEKNFSCGICKRSFLIKRTLQEHIRVHTGERPFQCELCPFRASLRSGLKGHMKTHLRQIQRAVEREAIELIDEDLENMLEKAVNGSIERVRVLEGIEKGKRGANRNGGINHNKDLSLKKGQMKRKTANFKKKERIVENESQKCQTVLVSKEVQVKEMDFLEGNVSDSLGKSSEVIEENGNVEDKGGTEMDEFPKSMRETVKVKQETDSGNYQHLRSLLGGSRLPNCAGNENRAATVIPDTRNFDHLQSLLQNGQSNSSLQAVLYNGSNTLANQISVSVPNAVEISAVNRSSVNSLLSQKKESFQTLRSLLRPELQTFGSLLVSNDKTVYNNDLQKVLKNQFSTDAETWTIQNIEIGATSTIKKSSFERMGGSCGLENEEISVGSVKDKQARKIEKFSWDNEQELDKMKKCEGMRDFRKTNEGFGPAVKQNNTEPIYVMDDIQIVLNVPSDDSGSEETEDPAHDCELTKNEAHSKSIGELLPSHTPEERHNLVLNIKKEYDDVIVID